MGIAHVKQIDDRTCLQACLAMVTKLDIATVISHIGRNPPLGWVVSSFLKNLGFITVGHYGHLGGVDGLIHGRVYIVTTWSKLVTRGLHCVVVDCRGYEPEVFDPQRGRTVDGVDREAYNHVDDIAIVDAVEVLPNEMTFGAMVDGWSPDWSFSQSDIYSRLTEGHQ